MLAEKENGKFKFKNMPYSYSLYKKEYQAHMVMSFAQELKILDVGAGSGSYADLLKFYFFHMDAIEIFFPYTQMFRLADKYKNVFTENILEFDYSGYDYLIMGDIIEHLSVEDAQRLVNDIHKRGIKCMIAVPFLYEQGVEFDNVHEVHKQPDLTHEIFLERYPMMKLFEKDEKYGYYVNYELDNNKRYAIV